MEIVHRLGERALPLLDRLRRGVDAWAGARTLPLSVAAAGAAAGALFADRLARSMWRHAIFTGPDQWRTAALALAALWMLIGAITAVALLGPPADDAAAVGEAAGGWTPARLERSRAPLPLRRGASVAEAGRSGGGATHDRPGPSAGGARGGSAI